MLLTKAPTTLNGFVAAKIRSLMGENDVTQMQLGQALGKSDAYVNRRLQGRVPFDLNELDKIAALFGKSSAALLPSSPAEWPTVADDAPPSGPHDGVNTPSGPTSRRPSRAAKLRYATTPVSPVGLTDSVPSSPIRTIRRVA